MVSGPQIPYTGPRKIIKSVPDHWTASINNSKLGTVKRVLCGFPPFLGGERFLHFGTEFHLRCLNRKKGKWKPYDEDEKLAMEGMVKALHKVKLFTDNFPGAIIEKTIIAPAEFGFGIYPIHGTLDLNQQRKRRKIMIDLKTTSAETEEEFIEKALSFDYPRQGVIYEPLGQVDESYFIGCSKKNIGTKEKPIYPTFIFDLNNFSREKEEATNEAHFLLNFTRDFGYPLHTGIKRKAA